MFTVGIWDDFQYKLEYRKLCDMDNVGLTWLLIGTVVFTPISVVLDILFSPFELIYYIARCVVEKMEGEDE